MSRVRNTLKWLLPFVVSGGLLAYLLGRALAAPDLDRAIVVEHLAASARIFLPTLLVYGAVSLWIEAVSLLRLMPVSGHTLTLWTAARTKAASYLLYIVHYGLGAGALTYLLRRRGSITLADGAGIVLLIALYDIGCLLLVTGVSALLLSSRAPDIPAGWIFLGGTAIAAGLIVGFAVLRTPRPLGRLERLRSLAMFRAARVTPVRRLLELGVLRLLFVIGFIVTSGSALIAFQIPVPLGDAVVNIAAVAVVATLPIAVAGLGTGQAAFVYLFSQSCQDLAGCSEGVLLTCSLVLSAGLILLRAGIGFVCSREYAREALHAARQDAEAG